MRKLIVRATNHTEAEAKVRRSFGRFADRQRVVSVERVAGTQSRGTSEFWAYVEDVKR